MTDVKLRAFDAVPITPILVLPGLWDFLAKYKATIDPYAQWALATGFRTLMQNIGEGELKTTDVFSFAVEVTEPFDKAQLVELLNSNRMFPASMTKSVPGGNPFPDKIGENVIVEIPDTFRDRKSRFLTVRIDWKKASKAEREQAVAFLLALTISFGGAAAPVKRIQIGDARGSENPDRQTAGKQPELKVPAPPRVVLGVIEDDGAFAHAALRTRRGGNQTRVWALWDQTSTRPYSPPWEGPFLSCYGWQLDRDAMNALLDPDASGEEVDEEGIYANPQVTMPRLLQRESHGAAITSLFAGAWRGAPAAAQKPDPDGAAEIAPAATADDASRAPLILVQLPVEQTTISSGRWLAVNALDGLRYILDVTRAQGCTPPIVVNMSYGAIAGPHDGSGMLECAIDELAETYKDQGGQLAVVLAAGNAAGVLRNVDEDRQRTRGRAHPRVPSGVHAEVTVRKGKPRSFTLFVPPDKQTETHVEIWFDRVFEPDSLDKGMHIVVTPPDRSPWDPIGCGQAKFWPEKAEHEAGLMFYSRVAQGNDRSMALLCIAPTQVNSQHVSAQPGRWRIDLMHDPKRKSADPLFVEVWVERDDTVVGARRGQSARLVIDESLGGAGVVPHDRNTFTNVATGRSTFATGAVYAHDFALDGRVPPYSSTGADDDHGPLLSAVADIGQAVRGIRVSGSQSGMVLRANGTSVAAPQAARWIANQLAAGRDIDAVRKELEDARVDARRGHIV